MLVISFSNSIAQRSLRRQYSVKLYGHQEDVPDHKAVDSVEEKMQQLSVKIKPSGKAPLVQDSSGLYNQPVGRPPKNKTWNAQQGEWVEAQTDTTANGKKPLQQDTNGLWVRPVGRPPKGKVWNPTVGQYEDPTCEVPTWLTEAERQLDEEEKDDDDNAGST